jgi:hypothetical protein
MAEANTLTTNKWHELPSNQRADGSQPTVTPINASLSAPVIIFMIGSADWQ